MSSIKLDAQNAFSLQQSSKATMVRPAAGRSLAAGLEAFFPKKPTLFLTKNIGLSRYHILSVHNIPCHCHAF